MFKKGYKKFEDFEFSKKLQEAISEARFEKPTELQKQVIPLALEHNDVIFEARSGMGKSACFAIPFLQHWLRDRSRKGLIITSSAQSVNQLAKVITKLAPTLKARVLKFSGDDDYFYPEFHLKCPIIILELCVLERFMRREKEYTSAVRSLGLDDFDLLIQSEQKLNHLIQKLDTNRQTLISARQLTPEVLEKSKWYCNPQKLEKVQLILPETRWAQQQITLQYVLVNDESRFEYLLKLVVSESQNIVMIITDSDRISRYIVDRLESAGIDAHVLAYAMQLEEKRKIVKNVADKSYGILVGCEAALNGLSLPRISHLISWTLPNQIDSYIRRIDRFASQTHLQATTLISENRASVIDLIERRTNQKLICLNAQLDSIESNKIESCAESPNRENASISSLGRSEEDSNIQIQANQSGKTMIPVRFRKPVFASGNELEKLSKNGQIRKTLGSKFVPMRKRRM